MENREINPWGTTCEKCNAEVTAYIQPVGDDGITWAVYHCKHCNHDGQKQLLRYGDGVAADNAADTVKSHHFIPL